MTCATRYDVITAGLVLVSLIVIGISLVLHKLETLQGGDGE